MENSKTELRHELKSLIDGGIKDIGRFDEILNTLVEISFNEGKIHVCNLIQKTIDNV